MFALVFIAGIGVLGWLSTPPRNSAPPRRLIVFIFVFTFAGILPSHAGVLIQVIALCGGFIEWLSVPRTERRGSAVVVLVTVLIAVWALLIFHPNVPDFTTGLLGFRKSVLAVAGVVLGLSIRQRYKIQAERIVVAAVFAAVVVSIVGHLWVPEITNLVSTREADEYTATYANEERLQGVFAGPFHAALAGVFLFSWAVVRFKSSRWQASVVGMAGLAAIALSLVRTSYISLVLVVVAFVLLSGTISGVLKRATLVILAGLVSLFSVLAVRDDLAAVIFSIGDFATDGRFLNRFPGYMKALEMISASPIVGWGSGSSGDTLGSEFSMGLHVTSHNLLIKFAVEGGILGLAGFCAVIIAILKSLPQKTADGQLALMSLVGLFGFGITGSAIEALPVTYLIFVIVGIHIPARLERATEAPLPSVSLAGTATTQGT